MVSLFILKPVKSRRINSIKRIINNVNNLLLELISGCFNNLLEPRLNHVIK